MKSSSVSDSGKEWEEYLYEKSENGMLPLYFVDELLHKLLSQAEQRGYERGRRELSIKYGGQG